MGREEIEKEMGLMIVARVAVPVLTLSGVQDCGEETHGLRDWSCALKDRALMRCVETGDGD